MRVARCYELLESEAGSENNDVYQRTAAADVYLMSTWHNRGDEKLSERERAHFGKYMCGPKETAEATSGQQQTRA